MPGEYRTRFAPSPTGSMHLGHARTALVTWLRARSLGGTIVMRIEDLDRPRVVEGSADAFLRDHEWLGLDWDEGPLYQSHREALYESALAELRRAGRLYACTCSRKEIAKIASAPHGDLGIRYPGTCRNSARQPGRPEAIRFRGYDQAIDFSDAVFGDVGEEVDDFVLRRADGVWAYQLAVVVDDIDMRISEVVRGADLLSSTPRQIALHRALGCDPPSFVHVPLVLGADGRRLSKRHRSVSICEYRDSGWTPQQVIGLLVKSLGWGESIPGHPRELLAGFDLGELPNIDFRLPPAADAPNGRILDW